jgi:hypothetical protein
MDEALMGDYRECESRHDCNDVSEELAEAKKEIERLLGRNAALVECLRGSRCPYDVRWTVAECQQCGCTHGLFTRAIADEQLPHAKEG